MAASLPGDVRGRLDVMSADVFDNRTFDAGLAFDSVTNGIEGVPGRFQDAAIIIGGLGND